MSDFRLSLLGPFHATVGDHALSSFATDKVRALLIYLALEAGIPHRRESLATLLYPDWSDREALNNLRKTLFRLRSAIDAQSPNLSESLFTITRPTIELNSSAMWLDVAQFRQVVSSTLNKGRLTDEDLQLLEQAVALYRGELALGLSLPDAQPFDEWLVLQREALHQQVLYMTDLLTAAFERRGAYGQAQQYARRALALEPWREEAHFQLIRLLALNGQKSEALAQYESCRRLLDEELGVAPGAQIEELLAQIQQGILVAPPTQVTVSPRALLHRFPSQFTSFVGREEELEAVLSQLRSADCRLMTIVGPGGMGKTRLSVQVAQRLAQAEALEFRDGLYFVEAAPLTRGEELPSAIASALGFPLQGGSSPLQQVQNFLRTKAVLLVVDNIEQIVESGTLLVELLAECPDVKVLVTSRVPLSVRAEWRYPLDGLSVEGGKESKAFHLFVQRAKQVLPSLVFTEADEKAVVEMITLVGGSPLALEIAATWLRFYDATTIVAEIVKGMDFLETELQDMPGRHRSIRAVFDQSWQFLSAKEQQSLRQLSVLRGEWTLPQALVIVQGTPREIVSLGDKSLLRRTKNGRYTIHELLRQFAFEKLEESGELEATRLRHAQFFMNLWAGLRNDLYGMNPRGAVGIVREEWGNLRLAWSIAVELKQWALLLTVLEPYSILVELMGVVSEAIADFTLLADACRGVKEAEVLYAGALVSLGWCYYRRTEYDHLETSVAMVLALSEQEVLWLWFGRAWYLRGMAYLVRGKHTETEGALSQAMGYFERTGNEFWKAHGISLQAQLLWKLAEFDRSMALFEESLASFEKFQYPLGITAQKTYMGIIHRIRSNYEEALVSYRQCVEIAERLDAPADVARQYNNIGTVFYYLRDYPQAIDYYERALEIDLGLGHWRGASMEKGNIGLVYHHLHEYERALHYWDEAVTMARGAGLKGVEANYQASRGGLFLEMGEFEKAKAELEAGISLARSIENRPIVANYSSSLAWVLFRLGDVAQAMVSIDESAAAQARFGMREKLADTLRRKAVMLVEQGEKPEALAVLEQSMLLWKEIKGNNADAVRTESMWLWLKFELELGDEGIVGQLQQLLDKEPEEEIKAELLFRLWQVTKDPSYREQAQGLYQKLLEHASVYEYRMRLAELNE